MSPENTRERALPDYPSQTLEDFLVFLKHTALYEYAEKSAVGHSVLDLGCGEGYGSASLAKVAPCVVAADNSFQTVAHAAAKYARGNLFFVVCDAEHLPFRSGAFDVVTSFEVIEHLEHASLYLEEIQRAGTRMALISTPNRLLRLLPLQKPWNRYHRREYDPRGFARALGRVFSIVQMRGVTATVGVLEIEKRRVKQNPWKAYPRMVAQWALPPSLYDRLKPSSKDASAAIELRDEVAKGLWSSSDYKIVETGLSECITLVGICKLSKLSEEIR